MAMRVEGMSGAIGTARNRWGAFRTTMSSALIITRREVRDSFRDWRIVVPIVILTLIFPSLAKFAAERFASFVEGYGAELIGERTIPFLLMIVGFFPISISLVIALETFVGEKERRSLEPLLATPLTNTELYIGKTLAAMIPPLLTSYGGMAVYLAGLVFGSAQWRPDMGLIVQVILLTGAQALVMVTASVVISSQTTSVRAANLLASFVIIPMALLVQLESVIMFFAGYQWLTPVILGLLVADVLLIRMGTRLFNREEMLGRELDHLNLRWVGRVFWRAFRGEGITGLWGWWRVEVMGALGRLGQPSLVVLFCLAAAFTAGVAVPLLNPDLRLPLSAAPGQWLDSFTYYYNSLGGQSDLVTMAVWQNGRVLLAGAFLSVFTFGVGGLVLVMAPFGILGFLFAQFVLSGVNPGIFLAAVLPHSFVEVPAVILATAAALRLGVVFIGSPKGKTVGEAWLYALADTIKIAAGLVLPMLVLAALAEVHVTPRVVHLALFGAF
jgi:uncharacterized membrane protein SpoIIM required for sporulation/ABC-type transport system involved in multi-copper enzyme maturation permease subunit